jgi:hypothetical protein
MPNQHMNSFFGRSLLKGLFLFPSLHVLCQEDSVSQIADPRLKTQGFRTFLTGKNYRDEWTTPVKVPILDLRSLNITSLKEGGGKETRSLHIEEDSARKFELRSVEKFPENAVPSELRKTVFEKLALDGLSASYPYGVLSMGVLSHAAHVPFLMNQLEYIPDDSVLGEYRSKYKKSLVFMEDGGDPVTGDSSAKKIKTISTEDLLFELRNNHTRVDQFAVLRARLLDNFVMDFDRHEEQWEWYAFDSGKDKIYYPIPKDRDQVFFASQGLLPALIKKKSLLPELQGFRKKAKDITTFNRAVLNFDHFFLNELSEDDWSGQIDIFLNSMSDSVIEAALHKQPPEIQKYSAKKIAEVLKEKRRYFKTDMMNYYRFLSRIVSIVGTDNSELFSIAKSEHEIVVVTVSKIDSTGAVSDKLYEREFDPDDTKEIQIYGLEGDDRFVVIGKESKIKIRLIGGPGKDEFNNNSNGRKVFVYDVKADQNLVAGEGIRNKISNDAQANTYTRLQTHHYNLTSAGIGFEYANDGGIYIGASLKATTLGFRKEPYGAHQTLLIARAINNVSYRINYSGEFIKVVGNTDLLVQVDSKLPTARTHFFGIGNNTTFDKAEGQSYYLAHYDLSSISATLRSPINPWFQVKYGPLFQTFKLSEKENRDKYISSQQPFDSKAFHSTKWYGGAKLVFEINTKNSQVIPTRGIGLNIYGQSLMGLNKTSNNVSEVGGHFSLYTDFISKRHLVLASSFGASHIFGNYEIEQAQYLGLMEDLRGYRITRFAGRTRAYNNTELRVNFGEVNALLFRAPIGLLVFNDLGRVWADEEKSNAWHDGYGAGLWIAPLNRVVIAGSMTFSNEEKWLLLVNFGFQF